MIQFSCSGLADFGLPLFAKNTPQFSWALFEIRQNGLPLRLDPVPEFSAVLVNNTGQPILGFVEIWKWAKLQGRGSGTATLTPLASSAGIETLLAREPFDCRNRRIVLPHSRRLLTPTGWGGDNSDVLGFPPAVARRAGCCISFGSWFAEEDPSEITKIELHLDCVFLANGLVFGPDESGTVKNLVDALRIYREEVGRVRSDLQSGISYAAIAKGVKERIRALHANYHPRHPEYHRKRVIDFFLYWPLEYLRQGNDQTLISWLDSFEVSCERKFRRA